MEMTIIVILTLLVPLLCILLYLLKKDIDEGTLKRGEKQFRKRLNSVWADYIHYREETKALDTTN